KGVLEADRPIETLTTLLDQVEDRVDAIENALELSGLSNELWDTFEEIQTILEFAVRVRPLAQRNLLCLLSPNTTASEFDRLVSERMGRGEDVWLAREKRLSWKEPLSADDTLNALAQALAFEKSIFRFVQPAFWRLKKPLQARYDFSKLAVAPA